MYILLLTLTIVLLIDNIYSVYKNKYYKEKEKRENLIIEVMPIITALLFIISMHQNRLILAFLLLLVNSIYESGKTPITKDFLKYAYASAFGYWILTFGLYYRCAFLDVFLTIVIIGTLWFLLASVFNYKLSVIIMPMLMFLARMGAITLEKYRLGGVTIHDIFSIPTAMSIAFSYNMKIDLYMIGIVIFSTVFAIVNILYINEESKNKIKRVVKAFCIFILSILICGFYFRKVEISTNENLNPIETINASIIAELELACKTTDKNKAINELNKFKDDEKTEIQPNIICILGESYADITNVLDITPSRNAYEKFYNLESSNCRIGKTRVNIFGGGTSRSEWEFLTGLDIKKYSNSDIPFLNKCNHDYTFTSNENIYGDYKKTIIHPFNQYGWNRINVYKNFRYDNFIFREPKGMQDAEYVHGYVSDKYSYKLVKDVIENNDEPQFIKLVTIQNHGGYEGIELENEIKIEENIEHKEEIEGVLSLHELSSEAIAELIDYLEDNSEEPTIVIFYGDHYPGGLFSNSTNESYKTPYMVYSNFCELNDMPDELDLSLLYPYAKAAAGLPMTAYEKYLVSLDGDTVDLNMILSKMKGYVN